MRPLFVFCLDDRVERGLHVTIYSLLKNWRIDPEPPRLRVYFAGQVDRLAMAINETARRAMPSAVVEVLPSFETGRLACVNTSTLPVMAYQRLLIPDSEPTPRLIYLDVDLLIDVDLQPLMMVDLQGFAAAMVPEAPLAQAGDRRLLNKISDRSGNYFNSGVMVIDTAAWKREQVGARCLEFLQEGGGDFQDQSALNFVLGQRVAVLPERYNTHYNWRRSWPQLVRGVGRMGCVVHFVNRPKPWDAFGTWSHPFGKVWHRIEAETVSRPPRPGWAALRSLLVDSDVRAAYLLALKQTALFRACAAGVPGIKGVRGKVATSEGQRA